MSHPVTPALRPRVVVRAAASHAVWRTTAVLPPGATWQVPAEGPHPRAGDEVVDVAGTRHRVGGAGYGRAWLLGPGQVDVATPAFAPAGHVWVVDRLPSRPGPCLPLVRGRLRHRPAPGDLVVSRAGWSATLAEIDHLGDWVLADVRRPGRYPLPAGPQGPAGSRCRPAPEGRSSDDRDHSVPVQTDRLVRLPRPGLGR